MSKSRYPKAQTYHPQKADTLSNLGIVKWQGKRDGPGAVAAWKKLLETNPAYPDKDAVLLLLRQARQRRSRFLFTGDIRSLAFWSSGRQFDERPSA